MQKKVFLTYLILIVLTLSVLGIPLFIYGYHYIEDQTEYRYTEEAELLSELASESDKSFSDFVDFYSKEYDVRLTIIDENGEVEADSATEGSLDNHEDREEVKEALSGREYSIIRYSKTMKMDYFYVALPIERGDFTGALRLSIPLSNLEQLGDTMLRMFLITMSVVLVLALILAMILSRHLVEPIVRLSEMSGKLASGDFKEKIREGRSDEIGELSNSFNFMAETLESSMNRLQDRKTELETILTSMPNGVVAIDRLNRVLFSNGAFERIFHLSEGSILQGKELAAEVRSILLLEAIEKTRKEEYTINMEGQPFPNSEKIFRITGTPLPVGEDGKEHVQISVLLVIEDVTEIRRLETMRSEFVSNVTHELKTPLTSIRGFIDTLQNGAIEDAAVAHRFLSIIDVESERLYNLIEDILLLSRIENTKDIERVDCDVNRIAADSIELLSSKCNDKTTLVFEPADDLKAYPASEQRLKEIFINLIDNAIKYTEDGTITVRIEHVKHNLRITVKDTGIGMPQESLPRIFERFYRVDKGRSREHGGTGLGLSIVKHIVELYSGRIEVDSKLNEGSEFRVILPYPQEQQEC